MRLIAEFCQNHNGDFDTLMRMIDAAAEGGATHGKIQTIFAADLAYRERFEEGQADAQGRPIAIKRPYQPEYDRLKNLELSYEEHRRFAQACRNAGLEPLTTTFNLTCIPHIADLGWRSVKVASYDCGSLPLLRALSEKFDEIIVSTGATFDEEIEAAAEFLSGTKVDFTMLHCVTIYPTPLNEMHLVRMEYLRNLVGSVGLSDHSLVSRDGVKADLAALYLGADTIERHFTILPAEETRDGKVSITKAHLRQIADFSKLARHEQKKVLDRDVPEFDAMLGQAGRTLSHEELLNRDYYRGRFCNKISDRQVFNWEPDARALSR